MRRTPQRHGSAPSMDIFHSAPPIARLWTLGSAPVSITASPVNGESAYTAPLTEARRRHEKGERRPGICLCVTDKKPSSALHCKPHPQNGAFVLQNEVEIYLKGSGIRGRENSRHLRNQDPGLEQGPSSHLLNCHWLSVQTLVTCATNLVIGALPVLPC